MRKQQRRQTALTFATKLSAQQVIRVRTEKRTLFLGKPDTQEIEAKRPEIRRRLPACHQIVMQRPRVLVYTDALTSFNDCCAAATSTNGEEFNYQIKAIIRAGDTLALRGPGCAGRDPAGN